MTGQDIITGALQEIGAVGQGEPLSPGDLALGLTLLQELLNSADAEPLQYYREAVYDYNFPTSQLTYTLGPSSGNSFVGPVVQKITSASIVIPGTTSPVRCPLYVTMNANEWEAIGAPLVTTSVPEFLLFQLDPPNNRNLFTFWSVPDTTNSLEFVAWLSLQTIQALTDSFLFPPGYREWVRLKLAMKCCRPWRQTATLDLRQDVYDAERRIESFNAPTSTMLPDGGLPSGKGSNTSNWSWLTGDYVSR